MILIKNRCLTLVDIINILWFKSICLSYVCSYFIDANDLNRSVNLLFPSISFTIEIDAQESNKESSLNRGEFRVKDNSVSLNYDPEVNKSQSLITKAIFEIFRTQNNIKRRFGRKQDKGKDC